MARLDEHRGKQLLDSVGIALPRGDRAETVTQARQLAEQLGGACVVKALAQVTGRAARGWVRLVDSADEAEQAARELLSEPEVPAVRVEEKLSIAREFFAAVLVDDRAGQPVIVFSSRGGSGIEEIAREHPEDVVRQPIDLRRDFTQPMAAELAGQVGIIGKTRDGLGELLHHLYWAWHRYDCRSLEINPIVETTDGRLIAADCHAAIDDYAVFRHPELNIRIAREIGHEPNELELIAYEVEKHDYRGTFYFIQLADPATAANFVAFHGAGGGGSMMSMDALMKEGFQPANFCDTSGNPPASKVYRAAKVLLSLPGIAGYFASGSGVASQEQWQSANGLVKAFRELGLSVPAVIRLGGNQEERAIETLNQFCAGLDAPVEAYGKDDSARFCAERLRKLVDEYQPPAEASAPQPLSPADLPADAYRFKTFSGEIAIDQSRFTAETAQAVVACCPRQILKVGAEAPARVELAISPEDARKGKCIECLACELKACELGLANIHIELPMPTKDGYAAEGEER
ncbi:acetate--CoA ligase family protein [bacterium]|nr:acetate--CoA ligase family protein [bacterium]